MKAWVGVRVGARVRAAGRREGGRGEEGGGDAGWQRTLLQPWVAWLDLKALPEGP